MASFKEMALRAPGGVVRGAGEELGGFKKLILRGNVVDLAVGIVIDAAFTGVVQALSRTSSRRLSAWPAGSRTSHPGPSPSDAPGY